MKRPAVSSKVICCAVSVMNERPEQGPIDRLIHRWSNAKSIDIADGLEVAIQAGLLTWEREGTPSGLALTEAGETLTRTWILVVTNPEFGAEVKAQMYLREKGFEAWVPLYERTIKRGLKVTRIRAPLFSRYVFVRKVAGIFDERSPQRLSKILSTRHVHEVLCNTDGTPYAVPDAQIAGWRETMKIGGGVIVFEGKKEPKRTWMHGDRVQIIAGPLKEMFAFVMGPHFVGPKDTVTLQLDKDGGGVTVSARDEMLCVPPLECVRKPKASENSGDTSKKHNKIKYHDSLAHGGRRPWRVEM